MNPTDKQKQWKEGRFWLPSNWRTLTWIEVVALYKALGGKEC